MAATDNDPRIGLTTLAISLDGVDHGFVDRHLDAMPRTGAVFPQHWMYRVRGSADVAGYIGQVYGGLAPEPEDRRGVRIPSIETDRSSWDLVLCHCPAGRPLWNRVAAAGCRLGLAETPGLFPPPEADGLLLSPNLADLDLPLVGRLGMTHYPEEAGRRFAELSAAYGYPPVLDGVHDYRDTLDRPIERLTPARLLELARRCNYPMLGVHAEEHLQRRLLVLGDLLRQFPVDVLVVHITQYKLLLEIFSELDHDEEVAIAGSLDRAMGQLFDAFRFDTCLLFSTHGMAVSTTRPQDRYFRRTLFDEYAALFAVHGAAARRHLATARPRDLSAVYHTIMATLP